MLSIELALDSHHEKVQLLPVYNTTGTNVSYNKQNIDELIIITFLNSLRFWDKSKATFFRSTPG